MKPVHFREAEIILFRDFAPVGMLKTEKDENTRERQQAQRRIGLNIPAQGRGDQVVREESRDLPLFFRFPVPRFRQKELIRPWKRLPVREKAARTPELDAPDHIPRRPPHDHAKDEQGKSADQEKAEIQPVAPVRTLPQRRARTLAFRRVEVFTQVDIHFEPNCGRLISFSEDSIPHIGRKDKEKCA